MNEITQQKCTGCHACLQICPKQAIRMEYDMEGFLYPNIDAMKCVDCGLCQKVCPLNDLVASSNKKQKAFAIRNNCEKDRANSSSGGVYILLARNVIKKNGVVYGVSYDENGHILHQRTECEPELFQTSKYVQSEIGYCYGQVQEDLEQGRMVLFTGAPCQVVGLYKFLLQKHIKYDNLITADFICHGVPSPMIWDKYIENLAQGRKIRWLNFRDKSVSWGGFSLHVKFDDGEEYIKMAKEDPYVKGFLANVFLRPSCFECHFKTTERHSDITFADFWGIQKVIPELADEKGISAIIAHTEQGCCLIDAIRKNCFVREVALDSIVQNNIAMTQSVLLGKNRKRFYKMWIPNMNISFFPEIVDKAMIPSWDERIRLILVQIKRSLKK